MVIAFVPVCRSTLLMHWRPGYWGITFPLFFFWLAVSGLSIPEYRNMISLIVLVGFIFCDIFVISCGCIRNQWSWFHHCFSRDRINKSGFHSIVFNAWYVFATMFFSGARLLTWLMSEAKVSVPCRICQHWLTKDWSSSGKLLTIEAVEEACGERLRLRQYSGQFANDEQAQSMSEILRESDPPLCVSNLLLRQWYLPSMQVLCCRFKH